MRDTMILETERLTLRKHVLKDSVILHEKFGKNPKMFEYSAWNPYRTPEMAENMLRSFIEDYSKKHFYAWAIEKDRKLIGTIGAYDYNSDDKSIEIGFSIIEEYWGRGFAGEALKCVLNYLISKDDIEIVKAWSASENIGSRKVLEKCGMKAVGIEENAIEVNAKKYDQLNYIFTI